MKNKLSRLLTRLKATRSAAAKKNALSHLKASLKIVEKKEEDMVKRLSDGL